MKAILLLLLTCLPLWAATTYPMLSDTTNRTIVGGVTNLSFLNSNSVFTGTARWMGIATLTNTGNIFVGDGSGLTGVGMVTSGGLATNATIYGLTINTGSTNNALTGSRAMVTDANKGIISSATTATELGYVSGVTSALQTQIDAKAATSTLGGYVTNLGGLATNLTATGLTVATGQTNTHLTASSVVVTDANKGIVSGTTTADLATLSANQTFTGSNTFTQWSGESRWRVLLRTNGFFFPQIDTARSTVGIFTSTNFAYTAGVSSNLFSVTLPALKTTNSRVGLAFMSSKTNNILTSCFLDFTLGTNLITTGGATHTATSGRFFSSYNVPNGTEIFRNTNSFTSQLAQFPAANIVATPNPPKLYDAASYVDTAIPWPLTVSLICNSSAGFNTNLFFEEFVFIEYYELP